MKKILKSPYFYLFALTPAGLALCAAAKYIPGFADWYCANIYKPAAGALGTVTGAFPLSLMEIAVAAAVFAVIALSVGAALRAHRGEASVLKAFGAVLKKILAGASVVFFLFALFFIFNFFSKK